MRARLIFTREKLSVWSYRFRGFSRRFRSFGHSCWYSSVIVSLSMRPFRSRVQTKLFILFACKNSLLRKAGEEEKKENETKSFVGTTKNQSQQKSFLVLLLSPNPLSLSLLRKVFVSRRSFLLSSKYLFSSIDRWKIFLVSFAHIIPQNVELALFVGVRRRLSNERAWIRVYFQHVHA